MPEPLQHQAVVVAGAGEDGVGLVAVAALALAAPRLLDPGPNSLIRQLNSLFRFLGNSSLTY